MNSRKYFCTFAGLVILALTALVLPEEPAIRQNLPAIPQKSAPQPGSAQVPAATRHQVAQAYGKLPLSFEVNQGQTDSRVKFVSRGSGYNLFLTANEAVLSLRRPPANVLCG